MIRLKVREVAEKKGYSTAYQLQKLLDVQSTVAYRLWNGNTTMIALKTVELLCKKLKCTPSQLFEID
jgi:DNA-binding Xre family transcriptional regulator